MTVGGDRPSLFAEVNAGFSMHERWIATLVVVLAAAVCANEVGLGTENEVTVLDDGEP